MRRVEGPIGMEYPHTQIGRLRLVPTVALEPDVAGFSQRATPGHSWATLDNPLLMALGHPLRAAVGAPLAPRGHGYHPSALRGYMS